MANRQALENEAYRLTQEYLEKTVDNSPDDELKENLIAELKIIRRHSLLHSYENRKRPVIHTALHYAVQRKNANAFGLLLEAGWDINEKNRKEETSICPIIDTSLNYRYRGLYLNKDFIHHLLTQELPPYYRDRLVSALEDEAYQEQIETYLRNIEALDETIAMRSLFGTHDEDSIQNISSDKDQLKKNLLASLKETKELLDKIKENEDVPRDTAQHKAIQKGNLRAIKLLLDAGWSLEDKDSSKKRPIELIQKSPSSKKKEIITYFLTRSLSPHDAALLVFESVGLDNTDLLKLALEKDNNNHYWEESEESIHNGSKKNVLHLAASDSNLEHFQLLLDHGYHVLLDERDECSRLPLAIIFWQGIHSCNPEKVAFALEKGIEHQALSDNPEALFIRALEHLGKSAKEATMTAEDEAIASIILSKLLPDRAKPNDVLNNIIIEYITNNSGNSAIPLKTALTVVTLILNYLGPHARAWLNIEGLDKYAIHEAIENSESAWTHLLIDRGANPNIKTPDGLSIVKRITRRINGYHVNPKKEIHPAAPFASYTDVIALDLNFPVKPRPELLMLINEGMLGLDNELFPELLKYLLHFTDDDESTPDLQHAFFNMGERLCNLPDNCFESAEIKYHTVILLMTHSGYLAETAPEKSKEDAPYYRDAEIIRKRAYVALEELNSIPAILLEDQHNPYVQAEINRLVDVIGLPQEEKVQSMPWATCLTKKNQELKHIFKKEISLLTAYWDENNIEPITITHENLNLLKKLLLLKNFNLDDSDNEETKLINTMLLLTLEGEHDCFFNWLNAIILVSKSTQTLSENAISYLSRLTSLVYRHTYHLSDPLNIIFEDAVVTSENLENADASVQLLPFFQERKASYPLLQEIRERLPGIELRELSDRQNEVEDAFLLKSRKAALIKVADATTTPEEATLYKKYLKKEPQRNSEKNMVFDLAFFKENIELLDKKTYTSATALCWKEPESTGLLMSAYAKKDYDFIGQTLEINLGIIFYHHGYAERVRLERNFDGLFFYLRAGRSIVSNDKPHLLTSNDANVRKLTSAALQPLIDKNLITRDEIKALNEEVVRALDSNMGYTFTKGGYLTTKRLLTLTPADATRLVESKDGIEPLIYKRNQKLSIDALLTLPENVYQLLLKSPATVALIARDKISLNELLLLPEASQQLLLKALNVLQLIIEGTLSLEELFSMPTKQVDRFEQRTANKSCRFSPEVLLELSVLSDEHFSVVAQDHPISRTLLFNGALFNQFKAIPEDIALLFGLKEVIALITLQSIDLRTLFERVTRLTEQQIGVLSKMAPSEILKLTDEQYRRLLNSPKARESLTLSGGISFQDFVQMTEEQTVFFEEKSRNNTHLSTRQILAHIDLSNEHFNVIVQDHAISRTLLGNEKLLKQFKAIPKEIAPLFGKEETIRLVCSQPSNLETLLIRARRLTDQSTANISKADPIGMLELHDKQYQKLLNSPKIRGLLASSDISLQDFMYMTHEETERFEQRIGEHSHLSLEQKLLLVYLDDNKYRILSENTKVSSQILKNSTLLHAFRYMHDNELARFQKEKFTRPIEQGTMHVCRLFWKDDAALEQELTERTISRGKHTATDLISHLGDSQKSSEGKDKITDQASLKKVLNNPNLKDDLHKLLALEEAAVHLTRNRAELNGETPLFTPHSKSTTYLKMLPAYFLGGRDDLAVTRTFRKQTKLLKEAFLGILEHGTFSGYTQESITQFAQNSNLLKIKRARFQATQHRIGFFKKYKTTISEKKRDEIITQQLSHT